MRLTRRLGAAADPPTDRDPHEYVEPQPCCCRRVPTVLSLMTTNRRALTRSVVGAGVAATLLTAVPAAGDSLPRVSISRNVTYATAARVSLKLDLYRVRASQPRPAVVIVHSGGWSDGDKAAFADVATRLARSGF